LNTSIRRFIEALEDKDEESMELRFREAVRTIDKTASKGVIHKNNAARKKSRLYKLYQKSREQ
jgi:small subunit ribosomal protein S20